MKKLVPSIPPSLSTPLLSVDEKGSADNALERFYAYFIKEIEEDPIPLGKAEKTQLALETAGGSAGIYFFPAAKEFAKNKALFLKYSLTYTNPISNGLFLIKATDDYLESAAKEWKAPLALSDLIELLPRKKWFTKQVKILLGTTACVVPFGIATYLYPLPGCDSTACLIIIVAHSSISNLILHAISWNLIFKPEYWYYRIPFLPFEMAYASYKNSQLTREEKNLIALEGKQTKIYQKYKDYLTQFFTSAAERIVNDQDKNNRKKQIELVTDKDRASLETFLSLEYEEEKLLPYTVAQNQQPSRLWCLCTAAHGLLMKGGIDIIGAGAMIIGCLGWIANPIYLAYTQGLSPAASVAAGGLPAYSMVILSAFYGTFTMRQIYEFLTTGWDRPREKFPFEARLYPKTFALFLLVNTYISLFTYATAEQLVLTIFESDIWDDYRPAIQGITYPMMQSMTFVSLLSLFNNFMRKSLAKFGSKNDDQMASRLLVKIDVMNQRLQQVKGAALMASLASYTPTQLKYMGIKLEEFQADNKTLAQLTAEMPAPLELTHDPSEMAVISQSNNFCSFLSCKRGQATVSIDSSSDRIYASTSNVSIQ